MSKQKTRFIKFCIVGGSGVVVNLGLLFVLVEYVRLGENTAWLIAVLASILSNFLLNSAYTYRDHRTVSQREAMQRVLRYYLTSLLVTVFSFLVYKEAMLWGGQYIAATFTGIVLSTLFNYFLASKLVWRDKNGVKKWYLNKEVDV